MPGNSKQADFSLIFDILYVLAHGKHGVRRAIFLHSMGKQWRHFSSNHITSSLSKMQKRGLITKIKAKKDIIYAITEKGRHNLFLKKLRNFPRRRASTRTLLTFDIPESKRSHRNIVRKLLKEMDFIMIQKSVFMTIYELPEDFYAYLRETDLLQYFKFFEGQMIIRN